MGKLRVKATAALADRVAAMYLRDRGSPVKNDAAGFEHLRDYCDIATGSEASPGQLDRLTEWVLRRVAS